MPDQPLNDAADEYALQPKRAAHCAKGCICRTCGMTLEAGLVRERNCIADRLEEIKLEISQGHAGLTAAKYLIGDLAVELRMGRKVRSSPTGGSENDGCGGCGEWP